MKKNQMELVTTVPYSRGRIVECPLCNRRFEAYPHFFNCKCGALFQENVTKREWEVFRGTATKEIKKENVEYKHVVICQYDDGSNSIYQEASLEKYDDETVKVKTKRYGEFTFKMKDMGWIQVLKIVETI